MEGASDEGRAPCVLVSTIQWKPFWFAMQLYPQNDWAGWQIYVNFDVCTPAPAHGLIWPTLTNTLLCVPSNQVKTSKTGGYYIPCQGG